MRVLVKFALALSVMGFLGGCTAMWNDIGVSATDMRVKTIGR